jgi:hypothetical protein
MDVMGEIPDFSFDSLGAGLQSVFFNAWSNQISAASPGFGLASTGTPLIQVSAGNTFFGVDLGGFDNPPSLGTSLGLPKLAKLGISVSLRAIAQVMSTIWELVPTGAPVVLPPGGGPPTLASYGTIQLDNFDLACNGKGLSLTFSGKSLVKNESPLSNGWYKFSTVSTETPYIDPANKTVNVGVTGSTDSAAATEATDILTLLEALAALGLPFSYSALQEIQGALASIQAQLGGFALPQLLSRVAVSLLPQRIPIPDQPNVIQFLYDGFTLTKGHLASSADPGGGIPAYGAGGSVMFWGRQRPSVVPRIGAVFLSGPRTEYLADSPKATERPQVAQYTATLSTEFVNPKCAWKVVDASGQPFPGATFTPTTGTSLEVTYSKAGEATVIVDVTDQLGTRGANHGQPTASLVTNVLPFPYHAPAPVHPIPRPTFLRY